MSKKLKDLTIRDNFMFTAVMMELKVFFQVPKAKMQKK